MTVDAAAACELAAPTPDGWYAAAAAELPTLLIDHANCEKKAASTAIGLMFSYGEDLALGRVLARLAREELRHYEQVLGVLASLGIRWRRLTPARYAAELRRALARDEPQRRLDLLLMAALIEARSCERFAGLKARLQEPVAAFYAALEAAERRHREQYLELAQRHAAVSGLDCAASWRRLAALEADLSTRPDSEFRFHSGAPAPRAAGSQG